MASARWKGSTDIKEHPDSPEYNFDTGGLTVTRIFIGPFPSLLSKRPLLGGYMVDIGAGILVEKVNVKPLGQGATGPGQMTVTLVSLVPPDNRPTPFQPVYEIEWNMLERKLEQHPRYQTGPLALSDDDLDLIAQWEAATTAPLRKDAVTKLAGRTGALDFIAKKRKGEDAYRLYYPVARKTSQVGVFPAVGACGKVQVPPEFPQLPDGYVWLTSADRGTRTGRYGKWERQQEWDGADDWDEDLYPDA